MRMRTIAAASCAALAAAALTAGCASSSNVPERQGFGPTPVLPKAESSMVPTINVVKAVGWGERETPDAAEGLVVTAFARGLEHPRWLLVLPNGDVLVAETNAPERPEEGKGLRGWMFKRSQKKAGGAVPSANRITLLRDTDGDGVADVKKAFLTGLTSPFGMTPAGDTLYVANTDAIVKFPYAAGATAIDTPAVKVVDLPAGPRNHHWTKNVIASRDGSKLYVAIGSNSNAAEHGLDEEKDRAQVWEVDAATGAHRAFATGLRNPVGMAWVPDSGALWVAVNERDELGNDLVPDYMTSVEEGGFYGWPFSYWGRHVDTRVEPQDPAKVAQAIVPDYGLGAHTASLGLAYSGANALPPRFANGMFVGQHGSWNRKPRSGYKVVFVPFVDGAPKGEPIDVLTGFVVGDGDARGRPVGVAIDTRGGLLVADDVGNAVWRVTGAAGTTTN
jgi:glucose/arabinose dehydrogenase